MARISSPKREQGPLDAQQVALEQLKWTRVVNCLTFAAAVIGTITIGTVIVLVFLQLYPSAMTGADAVNLFYLFIALLLPIVPAFVMFKFLPKSSADASGPFSGLKIKLTGAFAGYFILAIFVALLPRPKNDEVWTVKGMIKSDSAGPILKSDELVINIEPPFVAVQADETFETKIPVSWKGGRRVFPALVIGRLPESNFTKVTIHLGGEFKDFGEKYHVQPREAEHELEIKDQIEVQRVPAPYIGGGTAPTPTGNLPTPVPTPARVEN
jgi:hypothetical protein